MQNKILSKLLFGLFMTLITGILLTAAACAAYPSSGAEIPEGSTLLKGEIIGEKNGWDGSSHTGAAAAFDGDPYSYYDPTAASQDYTYCGMDLGGQYILTKVMILPRDSQLGRYEGAAIEGSNDMDDWTTLFVSSRGATSFDWKEITDFDDNTGYRYYRYWNGQNHGDVAEVEFYGRPADGAYSGPVKLTGEVIGESFGWDGSPEKGAVSAFDGDPYTYYDPTKKANDDAYAGLDLGQPFILSKVRIMPREGWLDRFRGASIQGSNDLSEWTTLCVSSSAASSWDWQVFTEFDDNAGYRYYRYWNGQEHGDVGEVQLYGYPLDGNYTPPTPATMASPAGEVTVTLDVRRENVDLGVLPFKVQPGDVYPKLADSPIGSFIGWFTLPQGGEQVKEGDPVTRMTDHILYAHYAGEQTETEAPAENAPADPLPEEPDAETDAPEAPEETDAPEKAAEPEAGSETGSSSRVVPIVCIAVIVLSLAVMIAVLLKNRND
jgi:hypothetical protein